MLAGEARAAVCVFVARVQKRLAVMILTVLKASTLKVARAGSCLLLTHSLKVAELPERRTVLVDLAADTLDATAPVSGVTLVSNRTLPVGRALWSLPGWA